MHLQLDLRTTNVDVKQGFGEAFTSLSTNLTKHYNITH